MGIYIVIRIKYKFAENKNGKVKKDGGESDYDKYDCLSSTHRIRELDEIEDKRTIFDLFEFGNETITDRYKLNKVPKFWRQKDCVNVQGKKTVY